MESNLDGHERMKNIFVVMQNEYNYDSSCSQVTLATFDQAKADAKVVEMEARKVRQLLMRNASTAWFPTFEIAHPRPAFGKVIKKDLPVFKGIKKAWTKAQKAEYKRVEEENYKAEADSTVPFRAWADLRMEEHKAFLATFTKQEQADWCLINEDTFWSIEEVPFE